MKLRSKRTSPRKGSGSIFLRLVTRPGTCCRRQGARVPWRARSRQRGSGQVAVALPAWLAQEAGGGSAEDGGYAVAAGRRHRPWHGHRRGLRQLRNLSMPHISDLETLWRSPYRFWCCSCCGFVIQDTRHHVADPRALPPLRFRRGIDLRRVQMCVSWCCPCPRWMSWCLMCGHDGGPAPSSNSLSGYASSSPSPKFNLCLGPPRQAQSQEVPLCSSGHNIHLLAVPFWIFSCKKQKPRQNIFCCTVFWRTFLVF